MTGPRRTTTRREVLIVTGKKPSPASIAMEFNMGFDKAALGALHDDGRSRVVIERP
jgi:hypothetical protein